MQFAGVVRGVCVLLACGCAGTRFAPAQQSTNAAKPNPLILEKNEGERRVWRFADFQAHFILKVDPKNGGSPHLIFSAEDLAPGETIPRHRHSGADELLFLLTGTARVYVGASVREVHAGATVFIPADTWVSVSNIGNDAISLVGAFSEPGFEEFMRAASIREGEEMVPLSDTEADEILKKHSRAVIYDIGTQVASASQSTNATRATPLILEKNEGERRIVRGWPGHPDPGETFILKVDPKNGGSSHLVFFTASILPGKKIDTHRHPEADEILFLENGTAQVHLGETERMAHAGATVFIPAGTWISADTVGSDPVNLIAIFSAPGFEDFMRDTSAREGEKNIPLSQAEEDVVEKKHSHAVIYKEP